MTATAFDLAGDVVEGSATTPDATAPTVVGAVSRAVDAEAAGAGDVVPCGVRELLPVAYADAAAGSSTFAQLLAACAPGPELASLLTDTGSQPLSEGDRLAIAAAWQRMAGWVEAGLASAVVAVVGEEPELLEVRVDERTLEIGDLARHELGIVLRETEGEIRNRIHQARTLVHGLPRVHAALASGAITARHARVLRDTTDRMTLGTGHTLDDPTVARDHAARVDALCAVLLPVAARADDRTLARRARALVLRLDTEGAARRAAAARRYSTDVWVHHGDDGLATLTARMPSESAHACMQTIRAVANANHTLDPDTPIGYLRAAALTDLLLTGAHTLSRSASDVEAGVGAGVGAGDVVCTACGVISDTDTFPTDAFPLTAVPRVHVDLVMHLSTFLRLDEQPAELGGVGPIPADVARALLAADESATMRRLLTDPMTGHLLDAGRHRYTVDDHLRDYLELRDQRCRFPGCTRQADACDLDHATNFDGTNTTPDNLGALCRTHHLAKTHGGWHITTTDPTGACTWTAPTGMTYEHPAQTLLTDVNLTDASAHHGAEPRDATNTAAAATADDTITDACPACDTHTEIHTRLPYLHGHTTRHDPRISRLEAHAHHLGICAY